MISKINKFIVAFVIIGLLLYVMLLNRESIVVTIAPGKQITAITGAVLIVVFLLGILAAALVGLFFGIRAYFREKRLKGQEKRREEFYQSILKARGYLQTKEWGRARAEWERLVRKDPSNIIARVELSRSLEGAGEVREALKTLDKARTVDPQNVEVLFRAAELNTKLGNKTAAIDNLALILYNHPNIKAARLARDLSEDIERIEDALEYHRQLEQLGAEDKNLKSVTARLSYKKLLSDFPNDHEDHSREIKSFLKKFPNYVPALQDLSKKMADLGKIDEAAELLVKAAKYSGSHSDWFKASRLWINNSMPDRALAAARAATKETCGVPRISAEFDLIKLYLSLSMLEEAKTALDGLYDLAKEEEVELTDELSQAFLFLKGMCLNQLGEYKEAKEIWKRLNQYDWEFKNAVIEEQVAVNGNAPAPRLSTP